MHEKENDMGATSYLDNVYGTPSKSKESPLDHNKNASTMNEMIKIQKNNFVENFIKKYLDKTYKKKEE